MSNFTISLAMSLSDAAVEDVVHTGLQLVAQKRGLDVVQGTHPNRVPVRPCRLDQRVVRARAVAFLLRSLRPFEQVPDLVSHGAHVHGAHVETVSITSEGVNKHRPQTHFPLNRIGPWTP